MTETEPLYTVMEDEMYRSLLEMSKMGLGSLKHEEYDIHSDEELMYGIHPVTKQKIVYIPQTLWDSFCLRRNDKT